MSTSSNKSFLRLGIIAGAVLLAIVIGVVTDTPLILQILKALGLVLAGITILVTIHELGHHLTAKAFGMRVETFSIGFPPKIFSFTKGGTEYQIGATPLGGYVKISGIIDESFDTEHLKQAPEPYEFRAKPVWQRLIVMVGGVVMNILLGIFIFSMIKFTYGEVRLPMSEVKYGVDVVESSLGHLIGFRTGDKILSFKGQTYDYFEDLQNPNNLINDDAHYDIYREGVGEMVIRVPSGIQDQFSNDSLLIQLFTPDMPAKIVVDTSATSPAYAAGMRDGDLIVAIDSFPIALFSQIRQYTENKGGQTIRVTYERKGEQRTVPVTLTQDAKLMVGKDAEHFFKLDTLKFGFFGAFVPGSRDAFGFLNTNVKGFKQVATGNASASKSFMGPIQIAKRYLEIFERGGLRGFLFLTGALSMILAFVNILPIPALDGGHVMFLLYEMVTRREPSTKVRIVAQQIGMVFILGLMLLIIFNDVWQLF